MKEIFYTTIDPKDSKFIITNGTVVRVGHNQLFGKVLVLEDGGKVPVYRAFKSEIQLRFKDPVVVKSEKYIEFVEKREIFNIYRLEKGGTVLIIAARNKKCCKDMFNKQMGINYDHDKLNPKNIGSTLPEKAPFVFGEKEASSFKL
jgi:hypothetical protein